MISLVNYNITIEHKSSLMPIKIGMLNAIEFSRDHPNSTVYIIINGIKLEVNPSNTLVELWDEYMNGRGDWLVV